MTTELFREEEIIEIFVEGAKKALDRPIITENEKQSILKSVKIAYNYCPIRYMNQLIEIWRKLK